MSEIVDRQGRLVCGGEERCCTEGEFVGTRPYRDGFQAVRSKLGRPISVIRLRTRAPILASVF